MATGKPPGPEAPEPTIREKREQAARDGDVDAIWSELTTRHYSMVDQEELFGHLLRALEVRSRDPEAFAAETFTRMIGFVSYLTLRASFYVNHRIARNGRAMQANGPADVPADVAETLIPRLLDLQGHLVELLQAQATTARSWELARAKRAENGKAEAEAPRTGAEPRPRVSSSAAKGHAKSSRAPAARPRKAGGKVRPNGTANGCREPLIVDAGAINRIGSLLGGHGPGPEGVGRDD